MRENNLEAGTHLRNTVRLDLLSDWRVRLNGLDVHIRGLKARALFLVLVNTDRRMSRRDLAAMFWPGQDDQKARASLRQAVLQLRSAVKDTDHDLIVTTPDDVWLKAVTLKTDTDQILTDLGRGIGSKDCFDALRRASDIGREFDGISDSFDDWLGALRLAQRHRCQTVLEAECLNTDHSYPFRLDCAQCAYGLDDLNEAAVRAMMECYAALNDNARALAIYRDFCDLIDEELGAEPSLETQDLAVTIKLDAGPPPAQASAVPWPEPQLQKITQSLVAVLPFSRLGPSEIPTYTVLGVLDQITCRLASFRSLGVISSNSTRHFLDQSPQLEEVRAVTGARYIVSGSLQVDGDTGALTVQLVDCTDDRVVWAATWRVRKQDLFGISADLADEIATAIEPSLNIAELERARHISDADLEPHHLVLRAKDLMFSLRRAEFQQAKLVLDEALIRGPHFAAAHALMAEWHTICLLQRWSTHPDAQKAALEEHSRRAINLAPGNGRVLAMWGHNKIAIDRDYDGAIDLFNRALTLFPNDAETLIWTVPTLALSNHESRALGNGLRSFELSPVDPFLFRNEHFLSLAHYASGNYAAAAKLGLSCYQRAPDYGSNLRATIASLVAAGQAEQARPLAQHHNVIEHNFSSNNFRKLHGFRDQDRRDQFVDRLLAAGVSA